MKPLHQNMIFRVKTNLSVAVRVIIFFSISINLYAEQLKSEEMLNKIMDLHGQLATNEMFLAQAKMLGAYLQTAQPQDEAKKIEIYGKVLTILTKINGTENQISPKPAKDEEQSEKRISEGEQKGKSIFVPGSSVLEIFKADAIENIPKLPVVRTYWERDLAYNGSFLLPDRYLEIGKNNRYVAKFSFYYEAKDAGDYGFTLMHNSKRSICKLTIGGIDIINVNKVSSGQGVCKLEKGFHRMEFWLASSIYYSYRPEEDRPGGDYFRREREENYAFFDVKVLVPNEIDAVPFAKNMMLLKKE